MKQSPVAIVGLSRLLREGLQGLLRRSRFLVVGNAPSLEEALAGFGTDRPELAICAIATGEDAAARIEQFRTFQTALEGIRIVLLLDQPSGETLRDAAAAGVQAVLLKDISGEVLQRSLELVMLGQQLFPGQPEEPPPRPAGALIPFGRPAPAPGNHSEPPSNGSSQTKSHFGRTFPIQMGPRSTVLSERERQILRCLVDGAANKTIARDLHITEATVKVHIKGLLRKIRVNNRTQAAVWGLNNTAMIEEDPPPLPADTGICLPIRHAAS